MKPKDFFNQKEIIVESIKAYYDFGVERFQNSYVNDFFLKYEGYLLTAKDLKTDLKYSLCFGIDGETICCESFGTSDYCKASGHIEAPDAYEFPYYIGSRILDFTFEGSFIDVQTNKGLICFTAYNDHNGHYSHSVKYVFASEKQIFFEDYDSL